MATADEIAAARRVLQEREAAFELARTKYEQLVEQRKALSVTASPENRAQIQAQRRELDAQVLQAAQAYDDASSETVAAQRQLNLLLRSAPAAEPPVDSAGQTAVNSQNARDERATAQNPGGNATVTLSQATVEQPATDRLPPEAARTLVQTQAIPPSDINRSSGAFVNDGTVPDYSIEARPSTQAGVGARGDDAQPVTGNSTKDIINATFATGTNQLIVPRGNVLDDYASYTYQISWYLLTPQQYNNLIFSPKFNIANWSLLMQSGGAPLPATSNTSQPTNLPGRSPFFPLDYYIDDLELFSKFPGKGVGMPHNVLDIKFKVNEPNGITLIDNLYSGRVYFVRVLARNSIGSGQYSAVDAAIAP
jgi:hypothetical protein